jgi:hypothetical protein
MRANTRAIHALPEFSLTQSPDGKTWGRIRAPIARIVQLCKDHACTRNEEGWTSSGSRWLGLRDQRREDFHATGVATYPLELVKATMATLPQKRSRFAEPRAAVTGAYWDVPSVLANLPLAARTRVRNKLPPKHYKIALSMSCNVDAEDMAKRVARLVSALWDYTKAGGVCTIDMAYLGRVRASSLAADGLIVQFTLNASDLSAAAVAISPAFFRAVAGPLMTAFSEHDGDSIPIPEKSPFDPSWLYIGGVGSASLDAFDKIAKELALSTSAS